MGERYRSRERGSRSEQGYRPEPAHRSERGYEHTYQPERGYRPEYDHLPERAYSPRHDHYDYGRAPSPPRAPRFEDSYEAQQYGSRDGFTFRGAASSRHEPYMPQHDFSFRSNGPAFPPERPRSPPHYENHRQSRYTDHPPRGYSGRYQTARGGSRPPFKHFSRNAHERDLLTRQRRSPTPEQLQGMSSRHSLPKFKDLGQMSLESPASPKDDEDDDDDGPRAKRTKLDEPEARILPKWSNPDPYTVLPPPEAASGPKQDIVQVIRKAKTEAESMRNSSNHKAADFISFNMDELSDGEILSDSGQAPTHDEFATNQRETESAKRPSIPHNLTGSAKRPWIADSRDESGNFQREPETAKRPSFPDDSPARSISNGYSHPGPLQHNLIPPMLPYGSRPLQTLTSDIATRDLRPPKRKRGANPNHTIVLSSWRADVSSDPATIPWYNASNATEFDIGSRFNMEVQDFYSYVRPRGEDQAVRTDLICRVGEIVSTWPDGKGQKLDVHCFGSFATGLYLPNADMDLVLVSETFVRTGRPSVCQIPATIGSLANWFRANGLIQRGSMTIITKARVPIVKFTDRLTGVKVDISFENPSGLVAIETFDKWYAEFPAMPTLVALVKQLMAKHGLNEVHTGGIGGFSIVCLVVSMLQHMPEVATVEFRERSLQHLGELLMTFLELYGNRFDQTRTGIAMEPPAYFNKLLNQIGRRPDRLVILDPNNPENDLTGGTGSIATIFDVFRRAYRDLHMRLADLYEGKDVDGSILGSVWAGDYSSFEIQREMLNKAYVNIAKAGGPRKPPDLPDFYNIIARKNEFRTAVAKSKRTAKSHPKRKRHDHDEQEPGRHHKSMRYQ